MPLWMNVGRGERVAQSVQNRPFSSPDKPQLTYSIFLRNFGFSTV
jgi:hypothetical protein